jgi:uncharacterized protein
MLAEVPGEWRNEKSWPP